MYMLCNNKIKLKKNESEHEVYDIIMNIQKTYKRSYKALKINKQIKKLMYYNCVSYN